MAAKLSMRHKPVTPLPNSVALPWRPLASFGCHPLISFSYIETYRHNYIKRVSDSAENRSHGNPLKGLKASRPHFA